MISGFINLLHITAHSNYELHRAQLQIWLSNKLAWTAWGCLSSRIYRPFLRCTQAAVPCKTAPRNFSASSRIYITLPVWWSRAIRPAYIYVRRTFNARIDVWCLLAAACFALILFDRDLYKFNGIFDAYAGVGDLWGFHIYGVFWCFWSGYTIHLMITDFILDLKKKKYYRSLFQIISRRTQTLASNSCPMVSANSTPHHLFTLKPPPRSLYIIPLSKPSSPL